jgi:hypothetical protein
VKWLRIYNRLFEIINSKKCYFSGSAFISCVREIDPYFPGYHQYIDERRRLGKSTSRKDFFYDILFGFEEQARVRLLNVILDKIKDCAPEKVSGIRSELGDMAAVPRPVIHEEAWSADRLNEFLEAIDSSISSNNYDRAVTLAYSCLEGFLKAFVKQNIPTIKSPKEIIDLSKVVRQYFKEEIKGCPDETINMIKHICHTVDKARNRFSEAHFDKRAARWLAIFIRDLVNSEIRLLLHFMKS